MAPAVPGRRVQTGASRVEIIRVSEPNWAPGTIAGSSMASVLPQGQTRRRSVPIAVVCIAVALGVAATTIGALWIIRNPHHGTGGAGHRVAQIAAQVPADQAESDHGVVITQAEAAKVVQDYWGVHEPALVRGDLSTLGTLATGSAAAWERGGVACHCISVDAARPLLDAAYFVPRQTRYPAFFLVEAQTEYRSVPWVELLVFTRSAARASWRVTEDSGFGPLPGVPVRLGAPMSDGGGYDTAAEQAIPQAQRERAHRAAGQLAAFWQQVQDSGRVQDSATFVLEGQSLSRVEQIAAHPQDGVQSTGLVAHFSFFVGPSDPIYEVAESNGYELACQPVRETVVYTPGAGKVIVQDSARRNWGLLLEPGEYNRVVSRDNWQTCFLVPPDQGKIAIVNHDIGGATPSS